MKKIVVLFLLSIGFGVQVDAQEERELKGIFETNFLLNRYYVLDSTEKINYDRFLDSLDRPLVKTYLNEMIKGEYWNADSLITNNRMLSQMDARMISIFYTFHIVRELGLLGMPNLSYYDEISEETMVVYMSEKEYKIYRGFEGAITLRVKEELFIPETRIHVFQLIED